MIHRRIAPATRYPADPRAVFVLSLCIVAGLPLVLGVTKPGSIEALLPVWTVGLWGALLTIGSAVTLAGMARQTADGIIAEQVGSVMVGSATVFYAASIALVAGLTGTSVFATAIILGWGLSCFWRWAQLQALIRRAVTEAERQGS